MGRFDGKVVIVTGAARGQGEAEARLFASQGAKVLVADVLDEQGEAVAADIGAAARYVHLDVSDEAQWDAAIAAAVDLGGRLDALVNNAAILRPAAIEDTSLADYMSVINVNQVGCFLGMKAAMPALRDSGGGAIVNISSIAALAAAVPLTAYRISKMGINVLSHSLAIENAGRGVRVNTIMPGLLDTPMAIDAWAAALEIPREQIRAARDAMVPLRGKMGSGWDVAYASLFLHSDEAGFITGAALPVDGGQLTRVGG